MWSLIGALPKRIDTNTFRKSVMVGDEPFFFNLVPPLCLWVWVQLAALNTSVALQGAA
jgi:hypothetical protein